MNSSMARGLTVCALGLLLFSRVSGQETVPGPFSADIKMTSPRGEVLLTGKMYLAWPKLRMDLTDVKSHVTMFSIMDYRTMISIGLLPQFHSYTEIHLNDLLFLPKSGVPLTSLFHDNPCAAHPDWTCRKTGTEKLSGRVTEVWDITANDKKLVTEWIDTTLHYLIKTRSEDLGTWELSNIEEGQQPAPSLFQIPPGYTRSPVKSGLPQGH